MAKHKFNGKNANRDLANMFIWKAFNLIKTDYYILYSPIKYWKSQHIVDKTFIKGHCCNRENFNATEGCITLIYWENKDKIDTSIKLTNDFQQHTTIVKQFKNPAELLEDSNDKPLAYLFNLSNIPKSDNGKLINNIEAYTTYCKTQKAYKLGMDNILQQLPLWVANCYEHKNYTEIEVIMKSADGGKKYQQDREFLQKCFIWSCLTNYSICVSNDYVINQLCLYQDTSADKILKTIILDNADKELLSYWNKLLLKVKQKTEYKSNYKYNLRQIEKDINIDVPSGRTDKTGKMKMVKKYNNSGDIDDLIKQLKKELDIYHENYIEKKLFEYELLK